MQIFSSAMDGMDELDKLDMKKFFFGLFLLLVSGCGGYYIARVYGVSGKQYTAPDICQAVAACASAGETRCFYPHDGWTCTEQEKK